MLNLVLCLVLYTCFAFYCISGVLRDRCWFCCSVLTATVINGHYYYYYVDMCHVTLQTLQNSSAQQVIRCCLCGCRHCCPLRYLWQTTTHIKSLFRHVTTRPLWSNNAILSWNTTWNHQDNWNPTSPQLLLCNLISVLQSSVSAASPAELVADD